MFEDDPTIAAFAGDLRAVADATPAPVPSAALAAVLDGTTPADAYAEIAAVVSLDAVRQRRNRVRVALAGVGAAAAALVAIASTGSLPEPVQKPVARMAEIVGADLPDGDEPSKVAPTPTSVPPVNPPDDRPAPASTPDSPSVTARPEDGAGPGNSDGAGNSENSEWQHSDGAGLDRVDTHEAERVGAVDDADEDDDEQDGRDPSDDREPDDDEAEDPTGEAPDTDKHGRRP
jgi:hypothetical protein